MPWRRKWQPTPGFSPGESHGQRSLADDSPGSHKELDTTERLSADRWTFIYYFLEANEERDKEGGDDCVWCRHECEWEVRRKVWPAEEYGCFWDYRCRFSECLCGKCRTRPCISLLKCLCVLWSLSLIGSQCLLVSSRPFLHFHFDQSHDQRNLVHKYLFCASCL